MTSMTSRAPAADASMPAFELTASKVDDGATTQGGQGADDGKRCPQSDHEATGLTVRSGELVAPARVDHDPAPGQGPGPQGYRDLFGQMRTAFPDLNVEVVHLTASEDDVAFAYTLTGTHQGPFQGHEPNGAFVPCPGGADQPVRGRGDDRKVG